MALVPASGVGAAAPKKTPIPQVRVMVEEKQKLMRLEIKGSYTVQVLPSLKLAKKGVGLALPVTRTDRGIKLGQDEWAAQGLRVEPAEDRDLMLDTTRFRGAMDIVKDSDGTLYAVNRIDVESYLYGVLHHEMAHWWPMEALKAQAIAARTYALYQASVSRSAPYDLKSNTSSQVYGGSTLERFRTKSAVDRTAGRVLKFQDAIFPAYFHATCGGLTAGAQEIWKIDLPPIRGLVSCPYCRLSPHYFWKAEIPLTFIEEKMRQNGRPAGQILSIEVITQTPSARVGSLRITGTDQEVVMAAKDFRIWMGGDKMRSTDFTVTLADDKAYFSGKGWGHGVGLCQWGALGKSLLGHKHEDILKFYYPGAEIGSYFEEKKT